MFYLWQKTAGHGPFFTPPWCKLQAGKECPRLQTLDLRIAAIALTTNATLLSRNQRDFRRVPGLTVEDWTA